MSETWQEATSTLTLKVAFVEDAIKQLSQEIWTGLETGDHPQAIPPTRKKSLYILKISRNWILLKIPICRETNHVTGNVCKETVRQTLTHINCNKLAIFLFFYFFYFLNFKIFNSYMRSQTWTPLPPPSP